MNKPIIIRFADLFDRLQEYGRSEELLGFDPYKQHRRDDQLWIVTWPDHVRVPGYNGDATYCPLDARTVQEALASYPDALLYGELSDNVI